MRIDRLHPPVGDDRRGVAAVAVPLREPDRQAPFHRGRGALQRLAAGGGEGRPQQEVLGRVARDRELGDQGDVRSRLAGVGERGRDAAGVAVDVADDRVELGQRDAHGASGVGPPRPGCHKAAR